MRAARLFADFRSALVEPGFLALLGGMLLTGWLLAVGQVAPAIAVVVVVVLLIGTACWIGLLHRRVRRLANRDSLTGVASRDYFLNALKTAIGRSRDSGTPVSVAVLDCDDFKRINEQFGHSVGDVVLIQVAAVLAEVISDSGTVARIWGDAFGILLPGLPIESACRLLEEAQRKLKERMSANNWPLTFSTGVSSAGGTGENAETLLADADALMFEVKKRGRDGLAGRRLGEQSPKSRQVAAEVRRDINEAPLDLHHPSQFARQL